MTTPSRSHATEVVVGVLRKPPLTQVSVEPTVGVPVIVGVATGLRRLDERAVVGETTLMVSGSTWSTLPAMSIGLGRELTVWPTAEAGGV